MCNIKKNIHRKEIALSNPQYVNDKIHSQNLHHNATCGIQLLNLYSIWLKRTGKRWQPQDIYNNTNLNLQKQRKSSSYATKEYERANAPNQLIKVKLTPFFFQLGILDSSQEIQEQNPSESTPHTHIYTYLYILLSFQITLPIWLTELNNY